MKTLDLKRKADNNNSNGQAKVQADAPKSGTMPTSTAFDDKKDDAKKVDAPTATSEQAKPATEAPKAEATQVPAIVKLPVQADRPALNLESTLKLVEELHRRKIHRDNLLNTIKTLEDFEVLIAEDSEEIENNSFQGCKLTIEDDNRNTFITKNPAHIKAVAEFLNEKCVAKLAEIEADIVIPA